MDATIIAALVLFLAFIVLDARRRTAQQIRLIAEEKRDIAAASDMTASIGVFYPDVRTTVVMGASEDTGTCYYRVLRDGKVLNRSKISLANIARVELLVNGAPLTLEAESRQATSFLRATDVAGRCMSQFSPAQLQAVQRAGLRLVFLDEAGAQKALDITVLRMNDERHRFKRMELFRDAVWWRTFLDSAGANARQALAHPEQAPPHRTGRKFFVIFFIKQKQYVRKNLYGRLTHWNSVSFKNVAPNAVGLLFHMNYVLYFPSLRSGVDSAVPGA
ncbi:hypothetical protein SAMN05192586_10260 [Desulfovibrio legallii]|uniref:Uncharacterized protein n=2 Tax=Desulfovibrio legallii TaxID=571438 RepID=A0A1G7ISZ5_9BACT|nr:hypothetical protein SAMN05192586_10260 [Desulfovibrio legallii]